MSSNKADLIFNFGFSLFSKVTVTPVVKGDIIISDMIDNYINDDDDDGDDDNNDNNDHGDDDSGVDDPNSTPPVMILSNGQWVTFGLLVRPPSDWLLDTADSSATDEDKGSKGAIDNRIDEFYGLFEKYRDYLSFSYSLDDVNDDGDDHQQSNESKSQQPVTTVTHHTNKATHHIDLPSSKQAMKVLKVSKGVLITHLSKLQLRPCLIGKDLSLSLSLTLSLTARDHVMVGNSIVEEEREIRKLLEMNRYHPPGIPERKASITINVIDSLNMNISTQELSERSTAVIVKLSNVHPTSAIFVYDTTVLLNHTRLDCKGFVQAIGGTIDSNRLKLTVDDLDDYSEGMSDDGSSDDYQNSGEDFFPAHLFFDLKLVKGDQDSSTSNPFFKIDPGLCYSLVYIVTLKDADDHKVVKLPATLFVTPCVVEWSHFIRREKPSDQRFLSTLEVTHDSFTWSCASTFISSDYRKLVSDAVGARQESGSMEVSRTTIKVTFQAPEMSYLGLPIELRVSLLNTSQQDISRFHFSFESSCPNSAKSIPSIPFIVHENSHVVSGLKPGELASITLTILPLRTGILTLDGFRIRPCSGDAELLSLAHTIKINIFDNKLE